MKRNLLLSLSFFLVVNYTAKAQLDFGDLAPDWTLTDVNGNSWNLYSMLDSGKTVFIDYSAAWCSPCWAYHNDGTLKNLYNQYGPPGTNEIRVFFFEGETTNTLQQLNGVSNPANACSSQVATEYYGGCTRGDWVTGEPYVFVDLPAGNTFATDYDTRAFPTIFAICPNRVIRSLSSSLTAAELYAAASCAPVASKANDPALIFYKGNDYTCEKVNIKATLQNYGTTPLTACTITAKMEGTQVAQLNWTGNLANTYDAVAVDLGNTAINADGTLSISVTSADEDTSNNTITKLVTHRTPVAPPYVHDFETAIMPHGWNILDINKDGLGWFDAAYGYQQPIGGYGLSNNSIVDLFYYINAGEKDEFYTTQFDLTGISSAHLKFDVAYAQYNSSSTDKLEVLIAENCTTGTPLWATKYSKSGNTLKTAPPVTSDFIPTASQWRTDAIDLSSYVGKVISVKFRGTSNYGNNVYVDNIILEPYPLKVDASEAEDLLVTIYPNPATGIFYLNAPHNNPMKIIVYNMLEEIVFESFERNTNGNAVIDLSNQPNGIYSVKMITDKSTSMRKITLSR